MAIHENFWYVVVPPKKGVATYQIFYTEVKKYHNANQKSGGGLPGDPSREEADQRKDQALWAEPTGVSAGCRTE